MENASHTAAFAEYEARLAPHRRAFSQRASLALLGNAAHDPSLLHLFLIHYAGFGISMTRPVEDWVRSAGTRCRETGFADLGNKLIGHARHEAGHHRLMIADLWTLAECWNRRNQDAIDPLTLARDNLPASIGRYRDLHEEIIAGDAPYAQIALEYEIEALSVRYGAGLLAAADGALSDFAGDGLSFLREHVALDAGHTQFNARQISRLLDEHPGCLDALVETGARALGIYGEFIDDCLDRALSTDCGNTRQNVNDRLFLPPGTQAAGSLPEWLPWVRSLRSHILYDGGARPSFGPGGAHYGDPDPADLNCHHVTLFDSELPVGAARLLFASRGQAPSLIDDSFGAGNVRRHIEQAGFRREDCAEASRLVLHPGFRQGRNVRRLIAGLWALSAELGASAILAAVGTTNKQDRLFTMFGAKIIEDAGSVDAPDFADRLRLAYIPIDRTNPPDYPELEHMREFVSRHMPVRRAIAA